MGVLIIILLVVLLTLGVFWLVSLSAEDDEPKTITFQYAPKFGEENTLITLNISDPNSIERATRRIDNFLKRKRKFS